MKKLIFFFVILLILGGTAFFFGWMNLFVPANSYAVMVSKTNGFDEELIGPESGFVWRWQNLIPTNMSLRIFSLDENSTEISSKGTFPSGEVYAQAAPLTPNFSYDLKFTVSFRLRPASLISLVKNENLSAETLDAFYDKRKEAVGAAILSGIFLLNEKGEAGLLKNPGGLEKELVAQIRDRFTDIEITRITPQGELKIPDPVIYYEARKNYLALLEEQKNIEIEKMRRARDLFQRDDIVFERSLSQLQRYGELFNKYPVLLKYLFVTQGEKSLVKELPEIKELFAPQGTK
jgi:hypothetical protein